MRERTGGLTREGPQYEITFNYCLLERLIYILCVLLSILLLPFISGLHIYWNYNNMFLLSEKPLQTVSLQLEPIWHLCLLSSKGQGCQDLAARRAVLEPAAGEANAHHYAGAAEITVFVGKNDL